MVADYFLALFMLCSLQHSFLVNDLQGLGLFYLLKKNVESLLCFFVEFEEHYLMYKLVFWGLGHLDQEKIFLNMSKG